MPLLVESITALLNRLGIGISEFVHPIISVRRDPIGALRGILMGDKAKDADADSLSESWIHVQLDPRTDSAVLDTLEKEVGTVLADVRQVVRDTDIMRKLERTLADELEASAPLSRRVEGRPGGLRRSAAVDVAGQLRGARLPPLRAGGAGQIPAPAACRWCRAADSDCCAPTPSPTAR